MTCRKDDRLALPNPTPILGLDDAARRDSDGRIDHPHEIVGKSPGFVPRKGAGRRPVKICFGGGPNSGDDFAEFTGDVDIHLACVTDGATKHSANANVAGLYSVPGHRFWITCSPK
jgi:hypothetical protein